MPVEFDAPLEVLRFVNVGLTFLVLVAYGLRLAYRWDRLTHAGRATTLGLLPFPAVLAFGSWEALRQNAPTGARTVLVTVACALAFLVLARSRR